MISETELYLRCLRFVEQQSGGEWGEKVEREDARKLAEFVREIAAAAMREPSKAMEEAWKLDGDYSDHPTELYIDTRRWSAAIDAALGGTDAA